VERAEWDGHTVTSTEVINDHGGDCTRPIVFEAAPDQCKEFWSEDFCYVNWNNFLTLILIFLSPINFTEKTSAVRLSEIISRSFWKLQNINLPISKFQNRPFGPFISCWGVISSSSCCGQGSKSEVKTPRLGRLRLGQISTAEARLGWGWSKLRPSRLG